MEMNEVRENLLKIMTDHKIKHADVIRHINRACGYTVDPGEFSKMINGLLMTPKANRVIADAWTFVKKEVECEKANA